MKKKSKKTYNKNRQIQQKEMKQHANKKKDPYKKIGNTVLCLRFLKI